jgi:hypothetical protein
MEIVLRALRFARAEAIYLFICLGVLCAMMSGALFDTFGARHLFHDPVSPVEPVDCRAAVAACFHTLSAGLLDSPSFLTQFYLCIFAGAVYVFWISRTLAPKQGTTIDGSLRRLVAYTPFPTITLIVAIFGKQDEQGQFHKIHAFLGYLTGLFMIWLWLLLLAQQRRRSTADGPNYLIRGRAALNADLLLPATLLCMSLLTGFSVIRPFDGIVVLLCGFTVLYWTLVYSPGWIFWCLLVLVLAYNGAYQQIVPIDFSKAPYRVAALEEALGHPAAAVTLSGNCTEGYPATAPAVRIAPGCLLTVRKKQIDAWMERNQVSMGPPTFIVLTISGGAYRATFWAASILDEIIRLSAVNEPLEGLAHSVLLITGASGGMVAGAYFAVFFDDTMVRQEHPLESLIARDIRSMDRDVNWNSVDPLDGPIDSLTPIARRIGLSDLRDFFFPRWAGLDRGQELEAQWPKLRELSFLDFAARNWQGALPTMVLTPTDVETGQPVYISPLKFPETATQPHRLFLFDRLPAAQQGLSIATAVRLNAAFPIITPAATIPASVVGSTDETPHRLVDAGFFDNQGTDAAVNFLLQDDVVKWVSNNNGRVIVIEINAWPDALTSPAKAETTGWIDVLPHLEFLSAPVSAFLSTRSLGAELRDLRAWQLVGERYNGSGHNPQFEKVTFRNVAPVSMSWYLTLQERLRIRKEVCAPYNYKAFKELASLWKKTESPKVSLRCPPNS